MKQFITIILLCAGIQLTASAQSFTQRIQQAAPGKGTVTISQSADIDDLVNNAQLAIGRPATTEETAENNPKATTSDSKDATKHNAAATTAENPTADASNLPVDNTKKILRGGYKIPGFRVQAFAGGNSRKDRQQAERVGNQIKSNYPDEPVYVHFYSPRWICRVGNYRTYEEAHQMLISLRKLGFQQATIVKGKITVTD